MKSSLAKTKKKQKLFRLPGPQKEDPRTSNHQQFQRLSGWLRDRNERDGKLVYTSYLWDLEPCYIGVIQLLSTMDILVGVYPSPLILILQEKSISDDSHCFNSEEEHSTRTWNICQPQQNDSLQTLVFSGVCMCAWCGFWVGKCFQ